MLDPPAGKPEVPPGKAGQRPGRRGGRQRQPRHGLGARHVQGGQAQLSRLQQALPAQHAVMVMVMVMAAALARQQVQVCAAAAERGGRAGGGQ